MTLMQLEAGALILAVASLDTKQGLFSSALYQTLKRSEGDTFEYSYKSNMFSLTSKCNKNIQIKCKVTGISDADCADELKCLNILCIGNLHKKLYY